MLLFLSALLLTYLRSVLLALVALTLLAILPELLHGTRLVLTGDAAASLAELLGELLKLFLGFLTQCHVPHLFSELFKFSSSGLRIALLHLVPCPEHMLAHHAFAICRFGFLLHLFERAAQALFRLGGKLLAF